MASPKIAPNVAVPPNEMGSTDTDVPDEVSSLAEGVGQFKRLQFRQTKIRKWRDVVRVIGLLTVYVGVSVVVMRAFEPDWTVTDAMYFAMATMSTVGYGDMAPRPDQTLARLFVILMIFTGVLFLFPNIAGVVSLATMPITAAGRHRLERLFPQVPMDLEGDGKVDFFVPRHPVVYYAKNLLPSFLLTITIQLISAIVFVQVEIGWGYFDAFYHCIVTATTVGYGDVPNNTQAGRIWSCVHILVSVAMLGELVATTDWLRTARQRTMSRIEALTTRLDGEGLDNLMQHAKNLRPLVARDGLGLTELEFAVAMMLELQVIDIEQIQPFIKQFRLLDVNGNARLGRDDIEAGKNMTLYDLKKASGQRVKLARSMTLGARMEASLPSPTACSPVRTPTCTASHDDGVVEYMETSAETRSTA